MCLIISPLICLCRNVFREFVCLYSFECFNIKAWWRLSQIVISYYGHDLFDFYWQSLFYGTRLSLAHNYFILWMTHFVHWMQGSFQITIEEGLSPKHLYSILRKCHALHEFFWLFATNMIVTWLHYIFSRQTVIVIPSWDFCFATDFLLAGN